MKVHCEHVVDMVLVVSNSVHVLGASSILMNCFGLQLFR